ncbi:MAG: M48 family metallopeptidase [Pseudobdellovibrionaceae bacterium]|nr:M48 family metallopeptidase [Bdellovibrionales bacterium]USN47036.1 MAG: M48 family metallopeptidase [Pseudobdellovibrionaceae bacterium]
MGLFSQANSNKFEFRGFSVSVLRRPYQRTIGVTVKPSGLIAVTASKTTPHRLINNFLKKCEPWIEKVQCEYSDLRKKYPKKLGLQGEPYLFKGEVKHLDFAPYLKSKMTFHVGANGLNCYVGQGDWSNAYLIVPQRQVINPIRRFYKNQGRRFLTEWVESYSQQMQLYPKKLSFRSQKTRWGSCSSYGSISLNWRLIAAPVEVAQYVVIHELAHLKYQNHSHQFWNLVEQHCPQWRVHRRWLSENQYEFDFLAESSELHPEDGF